jgi:hypothetical protein
MRKPRLALSTSSVLDIANEKQTDRGGKSLDRDPLIKDYQTLAILRIKAKMRFLSGKDVAKIRGYKIRHKNRKACLTLLVGA